MSVFHLKYRPRKIAELDLETVRDTLTKILKNKEIPQSFLFAGPKGSGKTSAARILARAVNCTNKQGIEPCGECNNCRSIDKGSMDVVEIDAASNRGIDDIRALRERAYLLPTQLQKKVFIIDEVHMLTKEAFNALLKLIEEPPKHTIFVAATTDPEKIPETILSRLIKVDFKKGSKKELMTSLKKAVKGEGIEIEDKALDLVIKRSEGSFRNAQKLLTELFLELGKNLSLEKVEKRLNQTGGAYVPEELEQDLLAGNVKSILEKLELMASSGVDFGVYRESLLRYFQNRLLAYWGIGEDKSNGMRMTHLTRWLNLLIAAGKLEKDSSVEQLPLQLAVVEFLGEGQEGGGGKTTDKDSSSEKKETQESGLKKIKENKTAQPDVSQSPVEDETSEPGEGNEGLMVMDIPGIDLDVEKVEQAWAQVLAAVKPYNRSVEAFLRAARPRAVEKNMVTVEVFYPFHKDRLEEAKNRKVVEAGLKAVFSHPLLFECVLTKTRKKSLEITNSTPMEQISEKLASEDKKLDNNEIYDVAKEIFG